MRHLWAIVPLLATSFSAVAETPADKARAECLTNALKEHANAGVALYASQGLFTSVNDVMARRHLDESYCLQYARCVVVGTKSPESAMGVEFSKCLDDEAEERLKNGVK